MEFPIALIEYDRYPQDKQKDTTAENPVYVYTCICIPLSKREQSKDMRGRGCRPPGHNNTVALQNILSGAWATRNGNGNGI